MRSVKRSAAMTLAGLVVTLVGYAVVRGASTHAGSRAVVDGGFALLCLGVALGVAGAILTVANALRKPD